MNLITMMNNKNAEDNKKQRQPLADRMRPCSLEEFVGQQEIIGENGFLRKAIEQDKIPSMILWGPPGCGKTTLAHIIAKQTKAKFIKLSAVSSGLKELKEVIEEAKQKKTILFIDEIHRWNKAQQDALLPYIEQGTITLIGATTENPSFQIRNALLSRCRTFVLNPLTKDQIVKIIKRALENKEKGLGNLNKTIDEDSINLIAELSNHDARIALNALESAASISNKINTEIIKKVFQKPQLLYDKNGEEHYNLISALHKSMRGSDANAALYWLARMLEAGEDPLYVARRLIRFASEDIGMANPEALNQAVAAYDACRFVGMPECNLNLAQAVVYFSKSKKSNELYTAYQKAVEDVKKYGNLPVPLHIRNAPTKLMKDLGYGKGYKYSPDYNYKEDQEYLPKELKDRKYLKE